MAILTESKIRKLLKTTDLKETKILRLEPGTIITPSAKGYLNDITVVYDDLPIEKTSSVSIEKEEPPKETLRANPFRIVNRLGQEVFATHYSLHWNVQVEKLISTILEGQHLGYTLQQTELIADMDNLLQILQDFRKFSFSEDYWERFHLREADFLQEVEQRNQHFSPYSFLPKYSDGEVVLMLYRLYTQVQELGLYGSTQLHMYLPYEAYGCLLERCHFLQEYVWVLMIRQVEGANKGG